MDLQEFTVSARKAEIFLYTKETRSLCQQDLEPVCGSECQWVKVPLFFCSGTYVLSLSWRIRVSPVGA